MILRGRPLSMGLLVSFKFLRSLSDSVDYTACLLTTRLVLLVPALEKQVSG